LSLLKDVLTDDRFLYTLVVACHKAVWSRLLITHPFPFDLIFNIGVAAWITETISGKESIDIIKINLLFSIRKRVKGRRNIRILSTYWV